MLIVLVMGKVLLDSSKMLVLGNVFELVGDKSNLMVWYRRVRTIFLWYAPLQTSRGHVSGRCCW